MQQKCAVRFSHCHDANISGDIFNAPRQYPITSTLMMSTDQTKKPQDHAR